MVEECGSDHLIADLRISDLGEFFIDSRRICFKSRQTGAHNHQTDDRRKQVAHHTQKIAPGSEDTCHLCEVGSFGGGVVTGVALPRHNAVDT